MAAARTSRAAHGQAIEQWLRLALTRGRLCNSVRGALSAPVLPRGVSMLLALLLATLPPLQLQATKSQLDNGLTVIVSPDRSVPGVVVDLWYHVGSKDEDAGRTGFAHLFEHLMFMGARYVPYPQFDTIMEAAGGTNNASTGNDTTHYYEVGPANLLETFLWMEADRMATLGREMTADKLETQRKIVLNERRQSYENRPYGKAELLLYDRLFPAPHPYSWPVIGSARDLEAATLQDVKGFFASWYVPSNATLAIVGDVEPEKARALVEKFFGWMQKAPVPSRPAPAEVAHDKEIRVAAEDAVELPKLIVAWVSPASHTAEDAACDLIAQTLGRGKASRLYTRLVHEMQMAADVGVGQESLELQSVFRIEVMARPGHTTAELLAAVDQEVRRFAQGGPTPSELESGRTGLYTGVARAIEGLHPRAELLNRYQFEYGDPTALGRDLGRYEAATTASVTEVARKLFGPGRVIIEIQPAAKKEAAP
jgi:zinc protease